MTTLVLNGYAKRTGRPRPATPAPRAGEELETGEPSATATACPTPSSALATATTGWDGPVQRRRSTMPPSRLTTITRRVVVKVGELRQRDHGGTDVFLGAIGQG